MRGNRRMTEKRRGGEEWRAAERAAGRGGQRRRVRQSKEVGKNWCHRQDIHWGCGRRGGEVKNRRDRG